MTNLLCIRDMIDAPGDDETDDDDDTDAQTKTFLSSNNKTNKGELKVKSIYKP